MPRLGGTDMKIYVVSDLGDPYAFFSSRKAAEQYRRKLLAENPANTALGCAETLKVDSVTVFRSAEVPADYRPEFL